MDLHDLSYVIVRIAESFMYRDVLAGEDPNIQAATAAIHLLVVSRTSNLTSKGNCSC